MAQLLIYLDDPSEGFREVAFLSHWAFAPLTSRYKMNAGMPHTTKHGAAQRIALTIFDTDT